MVAARPVLPPLKVPVAVRSGMLCWAIMRNPHLPGAPTS